MEKRPKAPLIYGYGICLISVITVIISVGILVTSLIDLSDLMHALSRRQDAPSLASFETYKLDMLKTSDKPLQFIPDDQTLQVMYQETKDDWVALAQHHTFKKIIVKGSLIIFCIILFLTHWRWTRRVSKMDV